MINIITRFSRRERFLNYHLPSIKNQTYRNFNHIITFEYDKDREWLESVTDKETTTLCKVHPVKKLEGLERSFYYSQWGGYLDFDTINYQVRKDDEEIDTTPNWKGGRYSRPHFPFNIYLLRAEKKVKEGFIIYLDDDDRLYTNKSLEILSENFLDKDTLYIFKQKFMESIHPHNFALDHDKLNCPPALGVGFGSSVFGFHSKYLEYTAWEQWSGDDWRTFQSLWYNIPKRDYIDEIIIEVPESLLGKVD